MMESITATARLMAAEEALDKIIAAIHNNPHDDRAALIDITRLHSEWLKRRKELKTHVKLIYFKESGKYYSEGEYQTEQTQFYQLVDEVRQMKRNGKLPGLVDGAREFSVLIEAEPPLDLHHLIP